MSSSEKRRLYQKPYFKDLSGLVAQGQLLGFCENGIHPTTVACSTGNDPTQEVTACSPTGFRADRGACYTGGNVAHGCASGSTPTT